MKRPIISYGTEYSDSQLPESTVLLFATATGLAIASIYYAQPLLKSIRRTFGLSPTLAGFIMTTLQRVTRYASGLVFLVMRLWY